MFFGESQSSFLSHFAMASRNLGTTVAPAREKFFNSPVVPVTSVDWFIPHFLIPWSFHNSYEDRGRGLYQ